MNPVVLAWNQKHQCEHTVFKTYGWVVTHGVGEVGWLDTCIS